MKQPKGKYAGIARVGEKGQIVIPKGVRDLFDIKPGDTLLVLADEKQGIAITKDDVLFQQFNAILGAEDPTCAGSCFSVSPPGVTPIPRWRWCGS